MMPFPYLVSLYWLSLKVGKSLWTPDHHPFQMYSCSHVIISSTLPWRLSSSLAIEISDHSSISISEIRHWCRKARRCSRCSRSSHRGWVIVCAGHLIDTTFSNRLYKACFASPCSAGTGKLGEDFRGRNQVWVWRSGVWLLLSSIGVNYVFYVFMTLVIGY